MDEKDAGHLYGQSLSVCVCMHAKLLRVKLVVKSFGVQDGACHFRRGTIWVEACMRINPGG